MQRFTKTVLLLVLSLLAGTISLMLITASLVIINYVRENQILPMPVVW